MSKRQIAVDTETTGFSTAQGHRVIEIGCVELVNHRLTGRQFQYYLNPDRDIDRGAFRSHGIELSFLADKPRFHQIEEEFLSFIEGAELLIHNAPFDMGFLDYEISLTDSSHQRLSGLCPVLDTLAMARNMHAGQSNSLDALCARYGIDNTLRQLHGALLDAELLADVYIAMSGG